jgi:hypothetical protein
MSIADEFTDPAARKPDPTLLERLNLAGPDHGASENTIIASVIAAAKGRAA